MSRPKFPVQLSFPRTYLHPFNKSISVSTSSTNPGSLKHSSRLFSLKSVFFLIFLSSINDTSLHPAAQTKNLYIYYRCPLPNPVHSLEGLDLSLVIMGKITLTVSCYRSHFLGKFFAPSKGNTSLFGMNNKLLGGRKNHLISE